MNGSAIPMLENITRSSPTMASFDISELRGRIVVIAYYIEMQDSFDEVIN